MLNKENYIDIIDYNHAEMIMRVSIQSLVSRADGFVTDRDLYHGLVRQGELSAPDNVVVFARDHLRPQDYAGTVHHRYVLIFFLRHEGTAFVQRHRVHAREGDVVLIRPFEQHYYAVIPKPIRWLFITFEWPDARGLAWRHPCVASTEMARALLVRVLSANREGRTESCQMALACLLDELGGRRGVSELAAPTGSRVWLMERIHGYIHDRLAERFTLKELAAYCGLSTSHVRLVFREGMGFSLGRYVQRMRMDRAQMLLQATDRRIGEIADACGFVSAAAFSRAFRKQFGFAPRAFRTQGRNRE